MPRDDLRRPLKRTSLVERLWKRRPGALPLTAILLPIAFVLGGAWLSRIPAPLAGQPVVMAAIPVTAEIVTSSTTEAEDPAPSDDGAAPLQDDQTAPPPEQRASGHAGIISLDDLPVTEDAANPPLEQQASIIAAPHRPLKKAPVEAVTEKTDDGLLPRVATDGRRPFDVYSQSLPLAASSARQPRIALVLGGMGLNAGLTRKAIDMLPGDVTLAFAPYGEDLQAQVNQARAAGHEVLLQLPMEPMGYPATNPGPKTILSDAAPEQNLAALKWLMSRFAGYSGVTNYMGARLLASAEALRPVMKELKARGLVFLEDAGIPDAQSAKVAQDLRLPVQRAVTVIDTQPSSTGITAALEDLEKQAAAQGSVVATGSGLDVTIETVAEWAKTLQEKGILLVPVSAAYKGRPS